MANDPFTTVAQRIHPGARLVRFWRLEGGVSATTHGVELETPDGRSRRAVIRQLGGADWKPLESRAAVTEHALLEALKRENLPVPEPYLADDSGHILPRPFVAMEFVDGATEIKMAALPGALSQLADALSRLHSVDIDRSGLPSLPPADNPRTRLWHYLPEGPLRHRLEAAIASQATTTVNTPSLLHGDFWPGNWLWHQGKLAAIIDWEDAALGDPLADIACARVELLCAYGSEAMDSFTRLYRSQSEIDWSELPLWEVYVSAAALATMSQWGLSPVVEAARRGATQRFIKRAVEDLLDTASSPSVG